MYQDFFTTALQTGHKMCILTNSNNLAAERPRGVRLFGPRADSSDTDDKNDDQLTIWLV